MKSLVFACPFLLLAAGSAWGQTAPLVARPALRSVVLYLNRAELEHQGTITLPAGTSTVLLRGLSPLADKEAVEIKLGDGAELLNVGNGQDADLDSEPAKPAPEVVDSLNRTQAELAQLEADLKGLEEEKAFLQANRTLPAGTQANWSAELQKGAALLRTRLPAIQLETNRLLARQQVLRQQAQALTARTASGAAADNPVTLTVRTTRAATVPLTARYFTYAGSQLTHWRPALELRANDAAAELTFAPQAQVFNQTRLDWRGVRLTLVNQELEQDVSRPELNPWTLDFDGGDNVGEGRIDQFVVKGTAAGKPADVVQSNRYELPQPVSLDVRGRRTLALPALKLAARPEYLALPKLSDKVFLQAKVTGWQGLQLPNKARVFYRGAYVGDTRLDSRAYNDSLEVSLGFDDRITVSRAKLEDVSGKTGLGGNRRVRLLYELNVRNLRPETVRVRVIDQVPVSGEKDIQVKVLETSGAVREERTGKLTWLVTLPPNANRKLQFGFEVEYPKDREVEIIQHRRRISSPKYR